MTFWVGQCRVSHALASSQLLPRSRRAKPSNSCRDINTSYAMQSDTYVKEISICQRFLKNEHPAVERRGRLVSAYLKT